MSIAKMRRQADSKTDEASQFEAQLQQRVQEAVGAKHAFVAQGERVIAERRRTLLETEDAIAHARDDLESLRMYKAVGHQELGRHLSVLQRTAADLREAHAATLQDMNDRFVRARERFAGNLDIRLERTKEAASDTALAQHRTRDMAEHADLRWLEMELSTHTDELGRLESCCLQLEEENLSLLARLSGGEYGTGRWASLETYKRQGEMARGLRIGVEDNEEGVSDGEESTEDESESEDEDEDESEVDESGEEHEEEVANDARGHIDKKVASARPSQSRRLTTDEAEDTVAELQDGGATETEKTRRKSQGRSRWASQRNQDMRASRVSFSVPEEEEDPTQVRRQWRLSQTGVPVLEVQVPDAEALRLAERQRRASGLKGPFKALALNEGNTTAVAKRPSIARVEEAERARLIAATPRASIGSLLNGPTGSVASREHSARTSEPSMMATMVLEHTTRRMSQTRGGREAADQIGGRGVGYSTGTSTGAGAVTGRQPHMSQSRRTSAGSIGVGVTTGALGRISLGGAGGSTGPRRRSNTVSVSTTTLLTSPALPPRKSEAKDHRRTSLPPLRGATAVNTSF